MKPLVLCAVLAGLAVPAGAQSAPRLGVAVSGGDHTIAADAFGRDTRAKLSVEGRGHQLDFFAGPCARPGRSVTHVDGVGQNRIVVAPCPR